MDEVFCFFFSKKKTLLACCLLLCAAGLPGIGDADPRAAVDAATAPWSALVRVQVPGVSRCTGVRLAPRLVLTAAHCVYGARLGHFAPAGAVHVLSGSEQGRFAGHAVAAEVRVGAGYDPGRADATRGADVALLVLAAPLEGPVLGLAGDVTPGMAAMLGGYSQDRAEIITADRTCHVVGVREEPPALFHDCSGTRGTSGAPVLVRQDGAWRIAGIESGAVVGGRGGVAVSAAVLRRLLTR